MQFIKTANAEQGIADISQRLISELKNGNKVLWMVCGGSNITAIAEVSKRLPADLTANLGVILSDERYGPIGHKDSNWQQLLEAGFIAGRAEMMPALQDGLDLEQTAVHFGKLFSMAAEQYDIIVAQLGMGADGHIAGILPGTPAAAEQAKPAVGYDSPPYRRLTLTFPSLHRVNTAYLLTFGSGKAEALNNLRDKDLPLEQQPVQILKRLSQAYVYNDQIGEAA